MVLKRRWDDKVNTCWDNKKCDNMLTRFRCHANVLLHYCQGQYDKHAQLVMGLFWFLLHRLISLRVFTWNHRIHININIKTWEIDLSENMYQIRKMFYRDAKSLDCQVQMGQPFCTWNQHKPVSIVQIMWMLITSQYSTNNVDANNQSV